MGEAVEPGLNSDPELPEHQLSEHQTSRLRIRSTETVGQDGAGHIALSVFCPTRGCSTPLSECSNCSRCHGWQLDPDGRGGRLTCHILENVQKPTPGLVEEQSPLSAPRARDGMHTKVSEVMACQVFCIEDTFPVDELMPLLVARNVSRVPVVDAAGAPLGIITKTDLLLRKHLDLTYRHRSSIRQVRGLAQVSSEPPESYTSSVRTVRDVMTGGAFALPEGAPVARAAALMAYEGVESIVIISQQGGVVGLLTALDITQWVARSHGFSLP